MTMHVLRNYVLSLSRYSSFHVLKYVKLRRLNNNDIIIQFTISREK
jgi:hypothetical protein